MNLARSNWFSSWCADNTDSEVITRLAYKRNKYFWVGNFSLDVYVGCTGIQLSKVYNIISISVVHLVSPPWFVPFENVHRWNMCLLMTVSLFFTPTYLEIFEDLISESCYLSKILFYFFLIGGSWKSWKNSHWRQWDWS